MRIARRCSPIHPRNNSHNLLIAKRRIIREGAVFGIGKPWWHLPVLNHRPDLVRAQPDLLEGEQLERGNPSGAMTWLAMLLHDGQHVPIKRRYGRSVTCDVVG